MKTYEMPYLFLFSDEELADVWSAYTRIAGVIRNIEQRNHIAITDSEVHAGAHFRAKVLLAEARRRDSLRGKALLLQDK